MEMYFPACLLPNRYAIGGLVVCFSFFVHLFFAVPPKRMSVHPGVFSEPLLSRSFLMPFDATHAAM